MSFTIGSLFDGSGGFPLAASLCGGTPKWASEIEPNPIAVTKSRFPGVKHLGSVTDINGGEVEPVDVITFGSPCQDLSVAGKRAGLKHEANGDDETTRSGLFMEAVRIIKEMREATDGVYPRFAVWENVPGAFSSNKGEDFRIVLQELIQVVEPTAVMPEVPKNGWPYTDSYCGDGWSIAYRVLDAQFWGVPQRRRRIYLVADFRGECAGKVSFEREGLRGYFETGRTPWQTVAGDAENCPGTADCERTCYGVVSKGNGEAWPIKEKHMALSCGGGQAGQGYPCVVESTQYTLEPGIAAREGGHIYEGVSGTLRANAGDNQMAVAYSIENHPADSRVNIDDSGMVQTLTSRMRTGGGNVPMVMESKTIAIEGNGSRPSHKGDGWVESDVMYTLNTTEQHAVAFWDGGQTVATLTANNAGGNQRMPDKENFNCVIEVHTAGNYQDKVGSLCARDYKGVGSQYVGEDKLVVETEMYDVSYVDTSHADDVVRLDSVTSPLQARDYKGGKLVQVRYIVRRLTPTECARLQGFPDFWGHPIEKTELTDEEYLFWMNVRNTHAAINDKATKEYTKDQILKWYNGLHTDSSEYKMWGNGIALPNALYVMQGIADVMTEEKASRKKWLDDILGGCL